MPWLSWQDFFRIHVMPYTEQPTQFTCAGDTLVGILTLPPQAPVTGVVIVVGGPQVRAGSHRQFVLLARALADAGVAVLRFDYRGMGDSSGALHTFENASDDIAAAVDQLLQRVPSVGRVVLWGLCDAASAALLYCHDSMDARVTGLCLLNPWVRSDASLAKTQVKHYYTQRLRQKEFWLKLLGGKVARGALAGFVQKLRQANGATTATNTASLSYQQRMAKAWHGFGGRILLILSGDDYVAKEFLEFTQTDPAWQGWQHHPGLSRQDLCDADHTFSNANARRQVEVLTQTWLA